MHKYRTSHQTQHPITTHKVFAVDMHQSSTPNHMANLAWLDGTAGDPWPEVSTCTNLARHTRLSIR